MKLLEKSIKSFEYVPSKDPEQLLYDFYFIIGFIPRKEDDPVMKFIFDEAFSKCVNSLHKHMLRAVKWSLGAELRHLFSNTSDLASDVRNSKDFLVGSYDPTAQSNPDEDSSDKYFTKEAIKFLKAYEMSLYKNSSYSISSQDRKDAIAKKMGNRRSVQSLGGDNPNGSSRQATYARAYYAMLQVQKAQKLSDTQLGKIMEQLYNIPKWSSSYGGKNWGKIAHAFVKLTTAKTLQDKYIWIDHAYDLQHNNGSVFTKVSMYNKGNTGTNWIAQALDWKRDNEKITGFYDKVSPSLKYVVAYVGKNYYDVAMNKPEAPIKPIKGHKNIVLRIDTMALGKAVIVALIENIPDMKMYDGSDITYDTKQHFTWDIDYPTYIFFDLTDSKIAFLTESKLKVSNFPKPVDTSALKDIFNVSKKPNNSSSSINPETDKFAWAVAKKWIMEAIKMLTDLGYTLHGDPLGDPDHSYMNNEESVFYLDPKAKSSVIYSSYDFYKSTSDSLYVKNYPLIPYFDFTDYYNSKMTPNKFTFDNTPDLTSKPQANQEQSQPIDTHKTSIYRIYCADKHKSIMLDVLKKLGFVSNPYIEIDVMKENKDCIFIVYLNSMSVTFTVWDENTTEYYKSIVPTDLNYLAKFINSSKKSSVTEKVGTIITNETDMINFLKGLFVAGIDYANPMYKNLDFSVNMPMAICIDIKSKLMYYYSEVYYSSNSDLYTNYPLVHHDKALQIVMNNV